MSLKPVGWALPTENAIRVLVGSAHPTILLRQNLAADQPETFPWHHASTGIITAAAERVAGTRRGSLPRPARPSSSRSTPEKSGSRR